MDIVRPFLIFFICSLSLLIVNSEPRAGILDHPIVGELEQGMASGAKSFDHSIYNQLLQVHVDANAGTVNYAGLKKQENKLDRYLAAIAGVDLETIGKDEQLALLINAYNAYTLKLIVDNYPEIESIRDLSDPWSTERYKVGGHTLSLDQIEHNLIRPIYQDPRIHFAVNCAARDCPYLADAALSGTGINTQLEARTRAILTNDRFVRIESGTLYYSSIMHWYEEDFTDSAFKGHASNIARYIARYSTDAVRIFIIRHGGQPPTSSLQYDWSLNDVE